MARLSALVVGLLLAVVPLAGVTQADAAARPATDFVTLDSAPGHFPGQGRSLSWSGDQITSVQAVGSFLDIEAEQGGWGWIFRAPEGERLRVGFYDDANGSMSAGEQPGINVGGDGRGCNEAHGRFRVLELAPDLSRIWILYEHRCENDDPSLAAWGEIRIGMPDVAPDLTLLPETLRLPDWYPGLDALAQPAMVFNTGTGPLTVTDAAVTAGQSDFRVVGGLEECAGLAPHESCRVFVGFRPTVAGDRTGNLRLTTTAGTRDVPLTGYGYPGTTEFRLHGGGTESYVVTPDVWTMIGNAADRIVHFYGAEPGYGGDWIDLRLTAPEGGFRAGHTYSACCTDVGPSIDLGITGRAVQGAAAFTVHQVGYDDDGELERFSVSFRLHNSTRGWYVGSIAWRATTPPAVPAIPPDSDAAPLTVETDRDAYDGGDVAHVTVTVPGGAGDEVRLYGTRRVGGPYLVGTASADALGRAGFDVPLTSELGFSAASGAHAGYATISVKERPVVGARASGFSGRQGRYLLFRAGRQAKFVAAATPINGIECLYAQVQQRHGASWRAASNRCLDAQDLTVVEYRLTGSAGTRKRVRFVLPAAGARPAAASAWIFVRFVRRPS